MYLDLSVPIDGKYMPTHASKAKKEAINAYKLLPAEVATPMDNVANTSITLVISSVL